MLTHAEYWGSICLESDIGRHNKQQECFGTRLHITHSQHTPSMAAAAGAAAKKKKGLSMDEKAARVEAFMLEQNQPFTMKELEQLLPKIGVPYPVVPECIETLVSENRVRYEKMGVSVF